MPQKKRKKKKKEKDIYEDDPLNDIRDRNISKDLDDIFDVAFGKKNETDTTEKDTDKKDKDRTKDEHSTTVVQRTEVGRSKDNDDSEQDIEERTHHELRTIPVQRTKVEHRTIMKLRTEREHRTGVVQRYVEHRTPIVQRTKVGQRTKGVQSSEVDRTKVGQRTRVDRTKVVQGSTIDRTDVVQGSGVVQRSTIEHRTKPVQEDLDEAVQKRLTNFSPQIVDAIIRKNFSATAYRLLLHMLSTFMEGEGSITLGKLSEEYGGSRNSFSRALNQLYESKFIDITTLPDKTTWVYLNYKEIYRCTKVVQDSMYVVNNNYINNNNKQTTNDRTKVVQRDKMNPFKRRKTDSSMKTLLTSLYLIGVIKKKMQGYNITPRFSELLYKYASEEKEDEVILASLLIRNKSNIKQPVRYLSGILEDFDKSDVMDKDHQEVKTIIEDANMLYNGNFEEPSKSELITFAGKMASYLGISASFTNVTRKEVESFLKKQHQEVKAIIDNIAERVKSYVKNSDA